MRDFVGEMSMLCMILAQSLIMDRKVPDSQQVYSVKKNEVAPPDSYQTINMLRRCLFSRHKNCWFWTWRLGPAVYNDPWVGICAFLRAMESGWGVLRQLTRGQWRAEFGILPVRVTSNSMTAT